MKKIACLLVAFVAIAVVGATERQDHVMPALESLKLERALGAELEGEVHYKVTKGTIEYLDRLRKEGRVLVVDRDGTIREK
jgi:hypothetical protein